jgi:hypothetical protein
MFLPKPLPAATKPPQALLFFGIENPGLPVTGMVAASASAAMLM